MLVLLDHPVPSAFCVPGDGGRVVLTTGALEVLSPSELAAPAAQAAALGAAGTATGERVLRLTRPDRRLGRLASLSRFVTVAVLAAVPLPAVALPATSDIGYHCTDATATPPLVESPQANQ